MSGTGTIRAAYCGKQGGRLVPAHVVLALCDALDAARARIADLESDLAQCRDEVERRGTLGREDEARANRADAKVAAVEALRDTWAAYAATDPPFPALTEVVKQLDVALAAAGPADTRVDT